MRRREFIAGLGSVAAWPLTALAQQPAMPVIGFLQPGSANDERSTAAFRQGLSEMGFVEGRNLAIEYRSAGDRPGRLPVLAADLVRRGVDVIAAAGATPALAAKAATATIPIIFVTGTDPVGAGIVASLNRPGGNATGIGQFSDRLLAKRIEMLRELVPNATKIGVVLDPRMAAFEAQSDSVQAAAISIGQQIRTLQVTTPDQLDEVFATAARERIGALVMANNTLFNTYRERLLALAAHHAIPTVYERREFAVAGGLMSYGSSQRDLYRHAGIYAGRVLKGEKPADLPVMQPTKFDLVINLTTAKSLGLTIPETLLATADEVIQ